jgi:RecB family exonuclease
VITPRSTRLLRVADLAAFQSALTGIVEGLSVDRARDTFVLVPTRAAAEQLRRTIEDRVLSPSRSTIVFPLLGTRGDLYDELAARCAQAPRLLSALEREVLVAAVARDLVAEGVIPPFDIRPGLVAEIVSLYDLIRRLGKSVADFDRNFRGELEKDREVDRGAEKLLQQTVFLSALYHHYEIRIAQAGRVDEHALRERLLSERSLPRPASSERADASRGGAARVARLVVTVADRIADADGLWPADFELLTRLPELESVEIVCTEAMLAAGLLERLHAVLPELQEERAGESSPWPALVAPKSSMAFQYRDREEELSGIARRLKVDRAAPLHRTALVVQRPLPYLYLARDVFGGAGVPFEAQDTLPLAAEPYAAALALTLDAVSSDFTRTSVLALLRSPHFAIGERATAAPPLPESIAALDYALSEARYLGGFERFEHLAQAWARIGVPASRDDRRRKSAAPAALAAVAAMRDLAPLAEKRPLVAQIETLLGWLHRFDRVPAGGDPTASRRLRVRAAVLDALVSLAGAYRAYDPGAEGDVTVLSATIRRWLGSQTFAASTGQSGLQIVDAQAARFGEFDDVQLLGLVDGEWPERFRRNVLYPSSLLNLLEPLPINPDPARRERDALNAARAAFKDLLLLARRRVRVSTFVLENDAVVEPSILLDDVETMPFARETAVEPAIRVFQTDALSFEPRRADALPPQPRAWAAARLDPPPAPGRFQGDAGAWTMPRVSVSRLERYLDCPFRFFASEVLRLEEQPEDEDTRTPLERGRFLHELFERFFTEWQKRGHSRIDAASLAEARALFTAICEDSLATLSPSEAALERTRLLGSAVSAGIAHRIFAMEAERTINVIERLLEFPLQGEFRFRARDGREQTVRLSAKTDRIDLLADGTLRVIDYKSKRTPDLKTALQLPIYSHCARVSLDQHRGRAWTLREALYVSFEGERPVVPLNKPKGPPIDELIHDAQDRLLTTLDRIAEGRFPPQPAKKSMCGPCPYAAVCRLEYVEEPGAPGAAGASGDE